jgi:hypothetical protein
VTTRTHHLTGHAEQDGCTHFGGSVVAESQFRDGLLVAPAFDTLLRENHLDSIDALFANPIGERLDKPGLPTWRERWRVTLRDADGLHTFYLKRFSDPPASARRQVRRSGTGAISVAGLEWAWINRLAREGIPCVRPVAFAEEFRGSREVRSAILTEAVSGDSLERWAARWTRADHATVHALIGVLAKLVARLHTGGYVHRDLYLSHIYFDPAAPLDDALCLIDLQRMIRPTVNLRRWIVKDLAALNYSASLMRREATRPSDLVSLADRLRWLKLYLGAVKLDGSARRLAYRVIGKTLRIQRRAARRRLREYIR